jgi:transglutaminase-like putative cysteine protease
MRLNESNSPPIPPDPGPTPGSYLNKRLAVIIFVTCIALIIAVAAVAAAWTVSSGKGGDYTREEADLYYVPGPVVQNIQFSMTYTCELSGENSRFELISIIPRTIDRRQEVSISYNPQPFEVFDDGETRYARFVVENPEDDFQITISGSAAIHRYDLAIARSMENPAPATSLEKYLVDEMFIEKDSKEVQEAAGEIPGENDIDMVENIYAFIADEFLYDEYTVKGAGAATALSNEGGTCSDYADAMVAVCRAKGIAAKTAYGIVIDKSMQGEEFLDYLHMWVEVYLQDYGWVPFDPVLGEWGMDFFDKSYPDLLRFSDVRNDLNLAWDYFYNYYQTGDPVEVTWSCEINASEPLIP